MNVELCIRFYKDPNIGVVGRLIKWWTKSEYYHVDIVVMDTVVSASADYNVVITNKLDFPRYVDKVYLNVVLSDTQLVNLHKWVNERSGNKYDYLGIFLSQIVPLRINNPDKWFCSELVVKVLQLCLYKDTYNLQPNEVSPGQLYSTITKK